MGEWAHPSAGKFLICMHSKMILPKLEQRIWDLFQLICLWWYTANVLIGFWNEKKCMVYEMSLLEMMHSEITLNN